MLSTMQLMRTQRSLGLVNWSLIGAAAVLALILSTFMPPFVWHPDENHYLMLALRRVDPDLFASTSSVFDSSNARFLAMYLMGSVVKLFGYETGHLLLRILMVIAYGVSFAFLFGVLGLTVLEGALVLYLYRLLGPSLLGGEWLFEGEEPKTWAYAAIVTALAFAVQGRWMLAAILATLATYFHFLVGGFWILILLFVYFMLHRKWLNKVFFAVFYAGCMLPLVVIIAREQSTDHTLTIDGLTPDYIYSFIRAPHHVAPFLHPFWGSWWARGAAATATTMLASIGLFRLLRSPVGRTLALSVGGVCAYLLVALIASYFDRNTGSLGKFFLFRPSSFALLLFSIVTILYLKQQLAEISPRPLLIASGILVIALISNSTLNAINQSNAQLARDDLQNSQLRPVLTYLRMGAPPDAVVVVDPVLDGRGDLPRLLGQPTLVGYKNMPELPAEIVKWYALMKFRGSIFSDGCTGPLTHRVDYLLVGKQAHRLRSCGKAVVSSGPFTLIAVERYGEPFPDR